MIASNLLDTDSVKCRCNPAKRVHGFDRLLEHITKKADLININFDGLRQETKENFYEKVKNSNIRKYKCPSIKCQGLEEFVGAGNFDAHLKGADHMLVKEGGSLESQREFYELNNQKRKEKAEKGKSKGEKSSEK